MRHCNVCGKTSIMVGHRNKLRGKYNPTKPTRKYPNLQKTKSAEGRRVLACTKCIKKMSRSKT